MFSVLKRASSIFIVLAIISFICSIGMCIIFDDMRYNYSLTDSPFLLLCFIIHLFSTPALLTGLSVIFKLLYKDLVSQDIHNALKFKDLKSDPTSK